MEANLTKNYWTFVGGTPTADYTYNKINPSAVCYNTAGRYATKLVVTNFDYFKDSITRYITVKDPPVLTTATTQYKKIVYPDTLHLKACAPQAAHLQWQPVTGLSCTDCASPILSYPYESVYTCIAWDNEGCQDTCNYYLTIDYGRKQVYLPNTFTPNGDGKNDFFTLYSNDAVRIIKQFQVFDRYGELVFSAENIAPNDERKGWDGSFKGMSFTPDVFAYRITVEYADGTTETLVGDVTVVK
jgi:gliding motility-associated-like protein